VPYHRSIRYVSPLVSWHELVLAESMPEWSGAYRPDSPRLLVPGTRWIEAEQRGQRFVCDALTPLVLMPDVPYRTRQPFTGQRSIVLVFGMDAPLWETRLRFGPAAQWRLARCRASLEGGVLDRLAFEEELLALLPANDEADPGKAERRPDRVAERARELLASDPATSQSLHEVACALSTSPFHLARRFKRANGIGLHGYRTRLRMTQALNRLAEGEDDLTRLALDLGYSSHSHFTAAFRAQFGLAPGRARSLLASRARFR
jgi:AraC family transcriptional regulator